MADVKLTQITKSFGNTDVIRGVDLEINKGEFVAKIVVSAVGALCEPSLPDIKGIDGFRLDFTQQ